MKKRLWVLGADDPEMTAIETILSVARERVIHATADDRRVHPGNAYKADPITCSAGFDEVILVECAPAWGVGSNVVRIDHHRPGDPGFGRPPEEYLESSSIGQVLGQLYRTEDNDWGGQVSIPVVDVTDVIRLVAACDHCLGAAYAGKCPGVDPEQVLAHRAAQRAQLLGISEVEWYQRFAIACQRLAWVAMREAQYLGDHWEGGPVELQKHLEEVPDAACWLRLAYVAPVVERGSGRKKVVIGGATTPRDVERFMARDDLVDIYGDPARGFAGGYLR